MAALFKIAPMVHLCAPEALCRLDIGHNELGLEAVGGGELVDLGACLRLLLR